MEILIIVAILFILFSVFIISFSAFQKEGDLNNGAQEIINTLRYAQNRALASEEASPYGVYFNSQASPNEFVLFKGTSYASRDAGKDKIFTLPETVEIGNLNFDGGNEVVFYRISGSASPDGGIFLRLKDDFSKTKNIYVENSGRVGLTAPAIPADTRLKDSRHAHFDYSRVIDTNSENLVLTFNETVVQEIPLIGNLQDGQIYWEGVVNAGGNNQKIKIHSHRLNALDTQFSVHRDRRYNTVSFRVSLSGDVSGDLINYSADGQTVNSSSIYASNLIWQ